MIQTQNNFPLSQVTTLAIGGPAKQFVEVHTEEELIEAIGYAKANNLEYLVIGGGSNLLVSDEGVEKLVIKNLINGIVIPSSSEKSQDSKSGDPSTLSQDDKNVLIVKSGTILQDLVNFAIEHSLAGLQKLTGIPGTVGGAIYGNAGAYGQSISDHLTSVTALDPNNLTMKQFNNTDCKFDYRFSNFKKNGYIILEATFQLQPGDKQTMEQEATQTKVQRDIKYPPGIKCPGSFFKNIVASNIDQEILAKIPQDKIVYGKIPAGALLEEVGAKGAKLGQIEIAPYHANLFINKGSGSAKDFYELAKQMSEKVKEKFGVTLEPEVQLLNVPKLI